MGRICRLCSLPASFTCQNCVRTHYCDRAHQREDWLRHKLECVPVLVSQNEILGRHLVASRDLKQGELILKEYPLVTGPRVGSSPVCVSCYRTLPEDRPRLCSGCGKVWVCGTRCESQAHAAECDAIRGHIDLTVSAQWVLPLRCLLAVKSAPEDPRWKEMMQLEAHEQERKGSVRWKVIDRCVVQELEKSGVVTNEGELLHKICGIIDVNSFEIRGPENEINGKTERLKGIYLRATFMSHSCIANTHLAVSNDLQLVLRAAVPISKGQKISFNYTGPIKGTTERLDMLIEEKYFRCTCARCSDPTELGTHMNSLNCPKCYKAGILTRDADATKNVWVCSNCVKTIEDKVVKTTILESRRVLEDLDLKSQKVLEAVLARFARTFHPNHAIMIDLKQMLIERYRAALLVDIKPCKKMLRKKIELCRQILPVFQLIEPGISRLRGLTLYAYHLSVVLLGNREYEAREISRKELITKLEEAETLLKDATYHLSCEPANSPEGVLAQQAASALNSLRETIFEYQQDEREQCQNGRGKRRAK